MGAVGLGLCHDRDTKKSRELCGDTAVHEAGAQAGARPSLPRGSHRMWAAVSCPSPHCMGMGLCGSDSSQLYPVPKQPRAGVPGNRTPTTQARSQAACRSGIHGQHATAAGVSSEGLVCKISLSHEPSVSM